jgi:plastocyanin
LNRYKEFRMNRRTYALTMGLVLGVSSLAACSSDKKATITADTAAAVSTPAGGTTGAAGAVLAIQGFAFGSVTATAGEAITVTNGDSAKHTVTADDGSFSVDVPAGGTATLTVATAGSYKIHCQIHSKMTGSITVS